MKKKNFRIEYLIYLFLLLTPFFDALSFLFREQFPDASLSPTTILRPIIPCILLGYIFFKDKSSRKVLCIGACIYVLYGVLHLLVYHQLNTSFNAGSYISEAQFVINYTYMIGLFYSFYWLYKQTGLPKLRKYTSIMVAIYLGLIFLAILTGTSSTTYIDGVGYKGWNASGNGLSAVFILGFSVTFTYLLKYLNKWYVWLFIIELFHFLLLLFGTRTALYGSILVVFIYGLARVFTHLLQTKKFNWKQVSIVGLVVLTLGSVALIGGSNVFKRRNNMAIDQNTIIDPMTNETSHLTGDLTNFVYEIKNDELTVDMSDAQKRALLKTYDKATKMKLPNRDRRTQQLLYHHYLFEEQTTPQTLLVGTGYLNQYHELTLEMEVPAFFYNFGLLGSILYFGPFLAILTYMIYLFFKRIKKVTVNYIMYLSGAGLSAVLSFLTGYVYFYVPSMLMVIITFILLIKEAEENL